MRDIFLIVLLGTLLLLVVNPMHLWMPTSVHMLVLVLLIGLVALMMTFLMRERGGDEREQSHRASAGRAAFFLGSSVLITGIVVQGSSGHVDPWLAGALFVMTIAKVAMLGYNQKNG